MAKRANWAKVNKAKINYGPSFTDRALVERASEIRIVQHGKKFQLFVGAPVNKALGGMYYETANEYHSLDGAKAIANNIIAAYRYAKGITLKLTQDLA